MCRYTLSHVAAQYGQTAFLYHVVLRWGAEVDPLDLDSRTPLHWAAYKGYGDTVRLLLVMSARQDLADREGCTPLHWAAIRGNGEACTLLLQVGYGCEQLRICSVLSRSDSDLLLSRIGTWGAWRLASDGDSRLCNLMQPD